VSGAELLSVAAFHEGRHAQAFPSFGSERMGAPAMAFCRIDDKPIRLREPVLDPDALIIPGLDATTEVEGNRDLSTVASTGELADVEVGVVRAAFGVAATGSVLIHGAQGIRSMTVVLVAAG